MMNASREASFKTLPDIVEPHNSKERLWNDIISFLANRNCKWKNSEVSSAGCSLIQALSNTFCSVAHVHQKRNPSREEFNNHFFCLF